MRHLDLFSGIGGFALATEMVWEHVEHIFCDIELFSQAVLRKHWPDALIYGDIRTLTKERPETEWLVGQDIDLLTGGFPCQPYSKAGKRLGTDDDRNLWPEMLRVIREVYPRWIIGENVDGILTWNDGMVFEQVCLDLEDAGYSVQPVVIPASAVGARHRRDRVWFLAHADGIGPQAGIREEHRRQKAQRLADPNDAGGRSAHVADPDRVDAQRGNPQAAQGRQDAGRSARLRRGATGGFAKWPAEPRLGRVAHGVPSRVDRIKALGNAIVPQVAAEIMRAIKAVDMI